jgi:hypothetical protein
MHDWTQLRGRIPEKRDNFPIVSQRHTTPAIEMRRKQSEIRSESPNLGAYESPKRVGCPPREVTAFIPDRLNHLCVHSGSSSGNLTLAISCGLGWRDACASTRRDNTDRQLDRAVRWPVGTVRVHR